MKSKESFRHQLKVADIYHVHGGVSEAVAFVIIVTDKFPRTTYKGGN
jgi:hypothetical protein